MLDVEAEFDRFVHGVIGERGVVGQSKRRGPRPATSAQSVFERAIDLIRQDGVKNLTARALAADLGISTRTLYKRIGSRANLIHKIATLHCAQFDLMVRPHRNWSSAAMDLCKRLYDNLVADPRMTELVVDHLDEPLDALAHELTELAIRDGVPPQHADVACRALVRITLNDALSEVRTPRNGADPKTRTLESTLHLILAGVSIRCRHDPTPQCDHFIESCSWTTDSP